MPHASACSAVMGSPSMNSPLALASPTKRGKYHDPPVSGVRPIFENACMNFADRAAITMSPERARLAPAPAATPLTAHTTGLPLPRMDQEIGGAAWRERGGQYG